MTSKNPEAFYKSLFDNMLDGVAYCQMMFDAQGHPIDFTYIRVNEMFEKMTGLSGVVGKRATQIVSLIEVPSSELFEVYRRISLSKQSERFEIFVAPLSKWFLVSIYTFPKDFFLIIFQDITSQKNIEKDLENAKIAARNVLEDLQIEKEALGHAKAKNEAMLTSIGDGVIIVDLTGRITFINQSAQNMLGWKAIEVLGESLFATVPILDEHGKQVSDKARPIAVAIALGKGLETGMAGAEELKKHISSSGITSAGMYYYVRKNKTSFPVSMTFSHVVLDNKIIGAIEVFRDIAREKEIDKAKSEFVSLASHQLKTPPTAIKLLTERILAEKVGTLTTKQREYFDDIRFSNQRMIDLINALLDVSRLELGAFSIQLSRKDVCAVLQDILHELKLVFSKKQIKLQELHQEKSTMLLIDEAMFRIVINNLVINAINYTKAKGTVRLDCKELKKGEIFGNTVLKEDCFAISVADTGCGIPKAGQERLFTKFFRADNAREKHPDGTGLGLYVVKQILDHSGGSISFISEENKGSTFYITIPMTGMRQG